MLHFFILTALFIGQVNCSSSARISRSSSAESILDGPSAQGGANNEMLEDATRRALTYGLAANSERFAQAAQEGHLGQVTRGVEVADTVSQRQVSDLQYAFTSARCFCSQNSCCYTDQDQCCGTCPVTHFSVDDGYGEQDYCFCFFENPPFPPSRQSRTTSVEMQASPVLGRIITQVRDMQ